MPVYKCVECGENFKSYNQNPKFCNLKCKSVHQATIIPKNILFELYYEKFNTQDAIAEKLGTTQKVVFNNMKRYGMKARVAAKRNQWGDKNHNWKGDCAGYQAMHRRMYSRFGKPEECEVCGTKDKRKRYDYASLSGNYSDIKDYKAMCRSCHFKYDNLITNIKKNEGR